MTFKKRLALLLACVMLLGLVAPAFAEDDERPAADPAPVTDPASDPTEDPADVTDPAEDPTDTTDPVDDPTDDPSDPSDDPSDPADDPADPEGPSDPTDPVDDPSDPSDPEDPDEEIDLEDIDDERAEEGETTYALWDADTKKLSLYYGVAPEDAVAKGFGFSAVNYGPFYAYREVVTSVVIDSSVQNARPTVFKNLFGYLSSLTTITGLQNLNTSNVKNMEGMFYNCSSLTTLDVSGWDTSNVTVMSDMFSGCSSLTALDVSGWDTSNVADMGVMFAGCSSLTTLNVSAFDTSKVTSMEYMFANCAVLTTLDLSSFDTSRLKNMRSMFDRSAKLHTVFVDGSKWNTESVTSYGKMFDSCPSLVGGKGTVVGSSTDKTYARIDEVGNPGYLTDIADKDRMNMGLSNDTEVLKQFYVDPIVTTENNAVFAKLPKNSYPRFSTTSYPKLLDAQYAGYIFAGYFDSIGEGATASREATETTGYARFIPIEVLDVYVQFRHTSRAATDPENKTDLRFITSVPDTDTLGYSGALVGFKLLNVTNGFTISNHAFGTQYCYDEIIGNYKVQDAQGNVFSLTPDRFYAGISAKVALQTVIGMPNTYFDSQKILSVQPYVITLDGTYSYAKVHTFQLKYAADGSKTAVPVA